MKKSRTLKIIRNELIVVGYVALVFVALLQVGYTKKITTYDVSNVNYVRSSHLLDKYVPKEPEPEVIDPMLQVRSYRMTSYYPQDELNSSPCTGTGLCSWDFVADEHGWYTYNGRIVLAVATTYLQKRYGVVEGKQYFKYYDEVNVTIDGVTYPGIILDTCGACYRDERIDLFVKDKASVTDRGYRGINMVTLEVTKKR